MMEGEFFFLLVKTSVFKNYRNRLRKNSASCIEHLYYYITMFKILVFRMVEYSW